MGRDESPGWDGRRPGVDAVRLCEAMAFMLIFVDSTLPFTGEVTVEYSTWVS